MENKNNLQSEETALAEAERNRDADYFYDRYNEACRKIKNEIEKVSTAEKMLLSKKENIIKMIDDALDTLHKAEEYETYQEDYNPFAYSAEIGNRRCTHFELRNGKMKYEREVFEATCATAHRGLDSHDEDEV